MKKFIKDNKYIIVCIILVINIIFPMFSRYVNGEFTKFNIISIISNTPFSKIIPTINRNLGTEFGIFHSSFPYKIGYIFYTIFRPLNNPEIIALKIVKSIIIILTMVFMFKTINTIFKSKRKAMLGTLFYLTSSYFYVTMYISDTLNESLFFLFLPLIFLSYYYLFKLKDKNKFMIYFIISYIGMIYSDITLTIYFTVLSIPFLLLYFKDIFNKENIKLILKSLFSIFMLTSTYLVPLIEHLIVGKWNIYSNHSNSFTLKEYIIEAFFVIKGGYVYITLSNIVVILCIISLYKLFKKKDEDNRKFIIGISLFTISALLLSTFRILWKNNIPLLETIIYPWRLNIFVVFGLSIIAVYGIDIVYNMFIKKKEYVCTISIIILMFAFSFSHYSRTKFRENINFYESTIVNYNLTDYMPLKAKNNPEYIKTKDYSEIKGNATTNILENKTPYLKFEVKDADKEVELELPRLYYLGYTITDNEGNKIDYKENKYGLISIKADNGIYIVKYTGTLLYRITLYFKTIFIMILIYIFIKKKKDTIN